MLFFSDSFRTSGFGPTLFPLPSECPVTTTKTTLDEEMDEERSELSFTSAHDVDIDDNHFNTDTQSAEHKETAV